MKIEHQKLLLLIARDSIFQALEKSGEKVPSLGPEVFRKCFSYSRKEATRKGAATKQQAETQFLPSIGNDPELKEKRATFVTLTIDGDLRGCIGMLDACRPLAEDVAQNAVSAAFHDPRFPPLSRDEFDDLKISISVLSPPQEMTFSSEADLLEQIRPSVDGLILQEGFRKGTFLPSVWEELPEKEMFFEHLKLKAGLPAGYWSDTLCVSRYTAEYIQ
jgi:AmmeMemoRadiSam system protein A